MSEQELWNELGNLYFLTGSVDPAIDAYSRAIQLDAWFGRPYSNLALAYVQKGKYEQAARLYRFSIDRLADAKEKAATWNRLGTVHRLLKDYKSALLAFQEADALDPQNYEDRETGVKNSELPLNLSTLPFMLDSQTGMVETTEIEANEAGLSLETSMAEETGLASSVETGFILATSDENLYSDQAQTESEMDFSTDELVQFAEEAGAAEQILPETELGMSIWTAEFPEQGLGQVETAEAIAGDSSLVSAEAAQIESVEEFDEFEIEGSPEFSEPESEISLILADMKAQDGDDPLGMESSGSGAADEDFDPLVENFIEPAVEIFRKPDANLIVESFVVDALDASSFLAEVQATPEVDSQPDLELNGTLSLPSAPLAGVDFPEADSPLEAEGLGESAMALAEPVHESDPSTEWSTGDSEELEFQIGKFTKKVQTSPQNAFAWDMLGNLQRLAGNYDEAERAYEQAISNEPRNAEFHYHLSLVYAAQMRHDDAVSVLRETLELDSSYYHAHATLGGYYRKLGLDELARHHINRAIKLGFQNDSEYNRACLEAICGRTEQALMLLEKALQTRQSNGHWARHDPDLEFIRSDPRFQSLITTYAS